MLTRRFFAKALSLVCSAALLVVSLGVASSRPIQAAQAAPAGVASPVACSTRTARWCPPTYRGLPELSGPEVTPDDELGSILKPAAGPVVSSTPGWHALPNRGLNKTVYALAMVGGDLYAGGVFDKTGDGAIANLTGIARFGATDGAWHALNNQGLDNTVFGLAVVDNDLYVGGLFTRTGDSSLANLGRIARYNTATGTWHALSHQGLDGAVYELTAVGNDLYVGGEFDRTGDGSLVNLGGIARYNIATGTWHALKNQGLNDTVRAIVCVGSNLYVAGYFTQTGDGSLTNLGRVARYNTVSGAWYPLSRQGLNGWVESLALVGSNLYVGGIFNQTGDHSLNLNWIARYDTLNDTWHGLSNQGLDSYVYKLEAVGSDLYVGGRFTRTGDDTLNLNRIARYRTASGAWHGLRNQGLNDSVHALAVHGDDLYVGGWFTQTGDEALTDLNRIARYYEVDYLTYLPLLVR